MTEHPLRQPLGPSPRYLTESEVLARARGKNVDAPAAARFVSYRDVASFHLGLGSNAAVHPERKVWVVTVHGDIETRGSLRERPRIVHVYSLVMDAEMGQVTDIGYGCAVVPVDQD